MPSPSLRRSAATALACGSLAAALLVPAAGASAAPHGGGTTARAFADAARAYHVPQHVLLAVGYLSSRWENHGTAPSTAGGYGPMNLTDPAAATAGPAARGDGTPPARPAAMLTRAAQLTRTSAATLRRDPAANIRGGAALLAAYARAAHGGTLPTTLAGWYPAVARWSGSATEDGARTFADDTWDVLRTGAANTLPGGERLALPADPGAATPAASALAPLHLAKPAAGAQATPKPECPASMKCDFVPAAYTQTDPDDKTSYGNYDIADRPGKLKINQIVLHDTEETYDKTLGIFTNPANQTSAHYVVRSKDGHVTQMVKDKDVAWQAGNWYTNQHSIGIEQEGYAAHGATWFTEEMYRSTSKLVRYLAAKYRIPIDRQHIIGHDNVPGTTTGTVAGMHWDPGPYWDWSHFMDLAGAPVHAVGDRNAPVVTVDPAFARTLRSTLDCENGNAPLPAQPSSFVELRTAPSDGAPLYGDPGLHSSGNGTNCANDWGDKASSGQQFAVAGRQGDWTAIWWDGAKVWFKNPASDPTAKPARAAVVTPKAGKATIPVYGRAYPEASAYPKDIPVQAVSPLGQYTIKAGQSYVLGGDTPADYYYAQSIDGSIPDDRTDVVGKDRYLLIQLGHRIGYVRAADVDIRHPAG